MNVRTVSSSFSVLILGLSLISLSLGADIKVTPGNPQGWAAANLRMTGSADITAANPYQCTGSLEFTSFGSGDKADFQMVLAEVDENMTFGKLSALSYEYYRDSASTAAGHFHPVLRLYLYDDAGTITAADDSLVLLIFEEIYQDGFPGAVDTDSWVFRDLMDKRFWMYVSASPGGTGVVQNYGLTLADWLAFEDPNTMAPPVGIGGDPVPPTIGPNTNIVGVNVGIGSGWGGTFHGFADNVTVGFNALVDSYNFEFNSSGTVFVDDDAGCGGNMPCFSAIQDALDVATDACTIDIAEGSYSENNLHITNDITLKGAGAQCDGGPLSEIDLGGANGLFIDHDGVTVQDLALVNGSQGARYEMAGQTIDDTEFLRVRFEDNSSRGIEFHNATTVTNARVIDSCFTNTNIGMRMSSSSHLDGLTVQGSTFDTHALAIYQANDGGTSTLNNLHVDDSEFRNSTDTAVFAEEIQNSTIENSLFEDNTRAITIFKNYTGAGVNVENLTISGNTFRNQANSSVLYYQDNSGLAGPVTIDDNTFEQDVGVLEANWASIDIRLLPGFTHGPVQITNNGLTFSGTFGAATAAYGIQVRGTSDDITIAGNNLDGASVGGAGVPPTSGVFVRTDDPSYGAMSSAAQVAIFCNRISGFVDGISVYDTAGAVFGGIPAGAEVNVNNNNISGNSGFGIENGVGEPVNAVLSGVSLSPNWWGAADGPSGAGPGSGDAVSANVDFSPWLGGTTGGSCSAGPPTTFATLTTLGSSGTTVFGESATFTASVVLDLPDEGFSFSALAPTGSVTFKEGAATLGSDALDGNGQASFSTSSLGTGMHTITAMYTPDAGFASSMGNVVQNVNKASTSTSLSTSPDPSIEGSPITASFTVVAVAPGAGTPTGTVQVSDGLGATCSASVAAGSCQLTPTGFGPKDLTATYSGDGDFLTSLGNDAHQVDTQVDLSIDKSGPLTAVRGGSIVYTLTVTNNGPSAAENVTVSDPTPAGLLFNFNSGDCATPFPCALGTIPSGASRTITAQFGIPVNYLGPDPVVNSASVGSSTTEGSPGDESDQAQTFIDPAANLAVIQTVSPNPADLNQPVVFSVTVTNNGPLTATGVTILEELSQGLDFQSSSAPGSCSYDLPNKRLTCGAGNLASGASFGLQVTALASELGSSAGKAIASSTIPDPNTGDNQVLTFLDVGDPDVDSDGIPSSVENAGPNGGDANDDGIPDSEQGNVATLPNAVDGQYVSLVGPEGSLLTGVAAVENPSPGDTPEGATFPLGLFTFELSGFGGGAVQVQLLYPADVPINSHYKYGPTPDDPGAHWYPFLFDAGDGTGATFGAGLTTLFFVDSLRGDDDLAGNGVIVDPSGPSLDAGLATQPTSVYFPQFADGVFDDIRFQSSIVIANTGGATTGRLDFFSSDGEPLAMPIQDVGTASTFDLQLPTGQSMTLRTTGVDPLQVGYAVLTFDSDAVGATAVLSRSSVSAGVLLYETGVPAAAPLTDFSIAVDSIGAYDTGVALVNPFEPDGGAAALRSDRFSARPDGSKGGPTGRRALHGDASGGAGAGAPMENDAIVTLRLYADDGTLLSQRELVLPDGAHLASFVWEFFQETDPSAAEQAREMRGTLTVASDRPLVSAPLRQNDDPLVDFPVDVPTLTTFPVAEGRFDAPMQPLVQPTQFFFPQIGFGQSSGMSFNSTLVFLNTSSTAQSATVDFFDADGLPLEVDFGGLGTGTSFEIPLAPGQSTFDAVSSVEELKTGYARVSTGDAVAGVAIFSGSDLETGAVLFEAGVPASSLSSSFSVVVDSVGSADTGLAVVNPGATAANVTVRLYDEEFVLVAETVVVVEAGGHLPRFIHELFADDPDAEALAEEFSGVLTVSSDQPLAAVVLRQNDDPNQPFPMDVPTLTTFPVLPGRADL